MSHPEPALAQAGATQPIASRPTSASPGVACAWDRRSFLRTTVLSAGALVAEANLAAAQQPRRPESALIDVNVNLGRWPLRRVPADDTPALVARLREQGVTVAWTGSLDGLLHKDLAGVNARLADECRRHGRGLLTPFGSVNPARTGWEEDLRRCAELHRMRGIRLHPNYHGYTLGDPAFARLLRAAAARGLIVQLAFLMEDERMMHPLWRVAPVDPAPLAAAMQAVPGLRLVLLNALGILRGEPLRQLTASADAYVEISMLEGVGGIANLLRQVPVHRVLFGSHAPLFYAASASLKLQESALTSDQLRAVRFANAERLHSP